MDGIYIGRGRGNLNLLPDGRLFRRRLLEGRDTPALMAGWDDVLVEVYSR